MAMDIEMIYQAIRGLPSKDRLRLVERVVRDVVEASSPVEPASIIGMAADEPELMDEVNDLAMRARRQSRMRSVDG